jgi:hypothetical protein
MASDLISLSRVSGASSLAAACSMNPRSVIPTTSSFSLASSGVLHVEALGGGASSGISTLRQRQGDESTKTAQITVDPTNPLTLDEILVQLWAQGFEVHEGSQVTVEGVGSSWNEDAVKNAKLTRPSRKALRAPTCSPNAITLKDLPKLMFGIVAWEVIKRISVRVGQYMWPVVIRWKRRRRTRAYLGHRLPDP